MTATTDVVISEKSKLELASEELSGTLVSRMSRMRMDVESVPQSMDRINRPAYDGSRKTMSWQIREASMRRSKATSLSVLAGLILALACLTTGRAQNVTAYEGARLITGDGGTPI